MRTLGISRLGAIAVLLCAQLTSAVAVTFTHDAFISFSDFSNDGQDIIVTNCTLTVDGSHSFNSLQLLSGAVLTHSPLPYGPQDITVLVTDESHALSATNAATLLNTNVDTDTITVMDSTGSILYTENADYVVSISNRHAQLTLTTNSTIAEGATVLVNYDWQESFQGFALAIANDANVAAGGAIDVSGKGYGGALGVATGLTSGAGSTRGTNFPFVFSAGGGGGHGGAGGMSSTFARGGASYDSTTNPAAMGSGGGSSSMTGGSGGGAATILVGGNFQIDGHILAGGFRGTNAHSGGGAGGAILLSAQTFSGNGLISANGGSGDTPDGGGGGGGRVALYFATNNFAGTMTAFGGGGAMAGGAGTIYLRADTNSAGRLLIVNGGTRGTNTTYDAAVSDLTISGGAVTQPLGTVLSVSNLVVGSNSRLVPSPYTDAITFTLNVSGNATVEAGGVINADFKSFSGPGSGNSPCGSGSGGSHGGYGGTSACGAPVAPVYDNMLTPISLGSPGALGIPGGGEIKMTVAGTLSLDGSISAKGASAVAANSGSGSGGSIWLTVGKFAGAGVVSVDGGSSSNLVSGGGGGGRVAIYCTTNTFTGSVTAFGGAGVHPGGPGSIYIKLGSLPIAQVVFDNRGLSGSTVFATTGDKFDLTITGGAVVTNAGTITSILNLRSLFIGSNSWFTPTLSAVLSGTVSNLTIQAGGGILANGKASTIFSKNGQSLFSTGGGGGGAGNGGASSTNAAGGLGVASNFAPGDGGGAGGSGSASGGSVAGGMGGGVIDLTIPGQLILDGQISVDGLVGVAANSGGGGGGSVRLSTPKISGKGNISANGGAGNGPGGGGGGGGAIALMVDTNLFTGPITAFGGSGANFGGAGVVTFGTSRPLNQDFFKMIVDNGGNRGAITPVQLSQNADYTITGGALVSNTLISPGIGGSLKSLFVGSNSAVQLVATAQITFSVLSNVTIAAGGSLNCDGGNNATSGTGIGQTLNGTGGGGGNAGVGGASALGAAGGNVVSDSTVGPLAPGGHGGSSTGIQQTIPGGNGGGALKLTVGTSLRVDGKLSAEGGMSGFNGGGGGGGSLSITTKGLLGSGIISANGGAGSLAGGGGGGGRIAISYTSNLFNGALTARGGTGANNGGAGTIYLTSPPGPIAISSKLIVDNGGLVPAGNTLINPFPQGTLDLTITGRGSLSNAFGQISTLQNLLIGSNSTWRIFSSSYLPINVQSNATIQSGGLLSVDGVIQGGPAIGQSLGSRGGGGGGHGGYGGASLSNALGGPVTSDAIQIPTGLGSSGGSQGGFGGGAMQLMVRGALQLDGTISANGVTSPASVNSGGGSGGSLWIMAGRLAGSGSISANGGAGNNQGGGGGGGRVAVYYNTNAFTGAITARGGAGGNFGGAGTVLLNPNATAAVPSARLILDNGGAPGGKSAILGSVNQADVLITNGTSVAIGPNIGGTWNNLTISANSSLGLVTNTQTLNLVISSNLTIEAGGSFTVDGEGLPANSGVGRGVATLNGSGGGGYGGLGSAGVPASAGGGLNYGSIEEPASQGSGGGSILTTSGSAGGGVMKLTVNRMLKVDGVLSANGGSATTNGAGGGSGGSISVSAVAVSGSGRISADGGDGDVFTSGGGSGGRIALTFSTNSFTGIVSAYGGAGALMAGGAGTIYFRTNSVRFPQLVVDNGGEIGTNTPLTTSPALNFPLSSGLSIRHGAVADTFGVPIAVENLLIDSGGRLIGHTNTLTLTVTVAGDALVDSNGTIATDGLGWNPGAGPGSGSVDFFGTGSGGGYGGAGGASFYGAAGGGIYGSSNQPTDFGSAGGVLPSIPGYSTGGGAIHLTVNGKLTVNGNISADGADGIIDGAGGGSGGSIWVTASKFSGNGLLTVNGGAGETFEGGGGGGGRIAVYAGSNTFSGTLLALGGDATFPGQNGTIYTPTSVLISGNVMGTNGAAVAGITLQPNGTTLQPIDSVVSDINGAYSVAVPPLWSGSITPSGSGIIAPSFHNYSAITADMTNQNFIVASPAAFTVGGGQMVGLNLTFSWYGINGVYYQPQFSSNLVDWYDYGQAYTGFNAPITITVSPTISPQIYLRLHATY